jgi:hypothetical protein
VDEQISLYSTFTGTLRSGRPDQSGRATSRPGGAPPDDVDADAAQEDAARDRLADVLHLPRRSVSRRGAQGS